MQSYSANTPALVNAELSIQTLKILENSQSFYAIEYVIEYLQSYLGKPEKELNEYYTSLFTQLLTANVFIIKIIIGLNRYLATANTVLLSFPLRQDEMIKECNLEIDFNSYKNQNFKLLDFLAPTKKDQNYVVDIKKQLSKFIKVKELDVLIKKILKMNDQAEREKIINDLYIQHMAVGTDIGKLMMSTKSSNNLEALAAVNKLLETISPIGALYNNEQFKLAQSNAYNSDNDECMKSLEEFFDSIKITLLFLRGLANFIRKNETDDPSFHIDSNGSIAANFIIQSDDSYYIKGVKDILKNYLNQDRIQNFLNKNLKLPAQAKWHISAGLVDNINKIYKQIKFLQFSEEIHDIKSIPFYDKYLDNDKIEENSNALRSEAKRILFNYEVIISVYQVLKYLDNFTQGEISNAINKYANSVEIEENFWVNLENIKSNVLAKSSPPTNYIKPISDSLLNKKTVMIYMASYIEGIYIISFLLKYINALKNNISIEYMEFKSLQKFSERYFPEFLQALVLNTFDLNQPAITTKFELVHRDPSFDTKIKSLLGFYIDYLNFANVQADLDRVQAFPTEKANLSFCYGLLICTKFFMSLLDALNNKKCFTPEMSQLKSDCQKVMTFDFDKYELLKSFYDNFDINHFINFSAPEGGHKRLDVLKRYLNSERINIFVKTFGKFEKPQKESTISKMFTFAYHISLKLTELINTTYKPITANNAMQRTKKAKSPEISPPTMDVVKTESKKPVTPPTKSIDPAIDIIQTAQKEYSTLQAQIEAKLINVRNYINHVLNFYKSAAVSSFKTRLENMRDEVLKDIEDNFKKMTIKDANYDDGIKLLKSYSENISKQHTIISDIEELVIEADHNVRRNNSSSSSSSATNWVKKNKTAKPKATPKAKISRPKPPKKIMSTMYVEQKEEKKTVVVNQELNLERIAHLTEACKNLIFIRKITSDYIQFLPQEVIHYGLLYNIFRCFQSLKKYQECGGSTPSINPAEVANLRNMIMHRGAGVAGYQSILDFATEIKAQLPNTILHLTKNRILQHVLTKDERQQLIVEFGLTEQNGAMNLLSLKHSQLVIACTPFYEKLRKFHEEEYVPDNSVSDRALIVESYMPLIKNILKFLKAYRQNPEMFLEHYLIHLQAIRMLVTMCGELSLSCQNQEIKLENFLAFCRLEKNKVGHSKQDFTSPMQFLRDLESKIEFIKIYANNINPTLFALVVPNVNQQASTATFKKNSLAN